MKPSEEGPAQVQRGAIETFKEFAATSFAVEHRTSVVVLLVITKSPILESLARVRPSISTP